MSDRRRDPYEHPPLPPEAPLPGAARPNEEQTGGSTEALSIELAEDRSSLHPGDTVAGAARWDLTADPTSVELRLFWFTEGRGTRDVEVVARERFEGAGRADSRSFRFGLPVGPYSFSGKLISLIWALELIIEPGDRATRRTITVGPDGREVMLPDKVDGESGTRTKDARFS